MDFGKGRTLGKNFGIIATGAGIHPEVIRAINQVRGAEEEIGKL